MTEIKHQLNTETTNKQKKEIKQTKKERDQTKLVKI